MSTTQTASAVGPEALKAAQPISTGIEKISWWKTTRAKRVALVTLLAVAVGSIVWWFGFHPYVSTDDARVAMTFVRVAPSYASGRIEKVNVSEGSRVKAGEVLLEIDHRIPQANFDKAKAKAELAHKELARMERLVHEGTITPQVYDQSRAASSIADADLKYAEVALENTYLKSPIDGIVVQRNAEVGNLLEQSQIAVVLADDARAWINANIEETAVAAVKVGQPVHITVDEGGSLEGRVSEVRSSVASQFALIPSDSGSGNFTKVVQRVPIKVEIDHSQAVSLRAGQSVELKIRIH
jgi:membrane fusion protein (multidrug efflux system)